ncbi:Transferase family [Musa troglodytarum]|uniref:Transferase family n=1 Tax=Musa troglodytarum TaxID=320322 RepID=A0A9E7KH49_9LILI|nr:Transferase family [Musa troglodytarum]
MVEVVESGMVVPSEQTPEGSIWLSNLDLLVIRAHTPVVYFYHPRGDSGFFSVELLKAALAKALVPFYPLAGRLGFDSDGRLEIKCTGEGVLFVVARSDSTLEELGELAPSAEMNKLFVPNGESDEPPLCMFQVTFFKCGGVCLSTAIHHTAADGRSALCFVNAWSDIARGGELTVSPCLDRTLLRARSPPQVVFDHPEYVHKQEQQPTPRATVPPPVASAILTLSKDQLCRLKSSGSGSGSGVRPLSTFKAVVAHVWRCACKARELADDEETRVYVIGDARTRMRPPLPEGYVGNAVFRTSATATVGEVLSSPFEFGADKIHGAIARLDDDYVRSLIDYMEVTDVSGSISGRWRLSGADLWVVSWLGLPTHGADFGWGKPMYMMQASVACGLVFVAHSPKDDGGVAVVLGLQQESMPRFKKAFYENLETVEGA